MLSQQRVTSYFNGPPPPPWQLGRAHHVHEINRLAVAETRLQSQIYNAAGRARRQNARQRYLERRRAMMVERLHRSAAALNTRDQQGGAYNAIDLDAEEEEAPVPLAANPPLPAGGVQHNGAPSTVNDDDDVEDESSDEEEIPCHKLARNLFRA